MKQILVKANSKSEALQCRRQCNVISFAAVFYVYCLVLGLHGGDMDLHFVAGIYLAHMFPQRGARMGFRTGWIVLAIQRDMDVFFLFIGHHYLESL